MRRPARVIQTTWLAMIALQSIGTIDTKHRLPAPKGFVAISALWGLLFILADTGLGKLAARLSLLILLTATVIGPFGTRLVTWIQMLVQRFAITPATPSTSDGGLQPAGPALT